MKILHLIDSGGYYGAEKVIIQLMIEQNKNGLIPILGSIRDNLVKEKYIEREAANNNLFVTKFRMRRGPNIFGALKIIDFGKKNKVDIIHCHGYKANILMGLIPSSIRRIPYINTFHGWTSTKKITKLRAYEWMDAVMALRANKSVAVSKAMLNHPKITSVGLKPICINNGIPLGLPEDESKPLFEEIPHIKGTFVTGTVGRLCRAKGFDYLLNSFARVHKMEKGTSLVIVGDGIERESLESLTHSLGISDNVFFLGYRNNAYKYIKYFDIFVMSSLTEGLPITLLEAMHSAVPIIATNVGGIPEALSNGKFGILVPPGDEDALAIAIINLKNDLELRRELSCGAKEWAVQEFSSEAMEIKYRRLYESLLV